MSTARLTSLGVSRRVSVALRSGVAITRRAAPRTPLPSLLTGHVGVSRSGAPPPVRGARTPPIDALPRWLRPLTSAPPDAQPPDDFLLASRNFITQLAPLVAFALALTMLLDKLVAQPLQAQMAQTQMQLVRIQATLEEVPRLARNNERLGKETDFLLSSKVKS